MFAVLVVITFAGDRIAKTWKEKVGIKTRKVLIVAAIIAVVVIAVVVGRSLTLSRPDTPKLSEARPVDVVSEVSRPEGVPLEGLRRLAVKGKTLGKGQSNAVTSNVTRRGRRSAGGYRIISL